MIYEFDFQFADFPIWVRADVTVEEALTCLKTGLLRNKSVARVKLFSITEENISATFVYDVTAAQTGSSSPWSIQHTDSNNPVML